MNIPCIYRTFVNKTLYEDERRTVQQGEINQRYTVHGQIYKTNSANPHISTPSFSSVNLAVALYVPCKNELREKILDIATIKMFISFRIEL